MKSGMAEREEGLFEAVHVLCASQGWQQHDLSAGWRTGRAGGSKAEQSPKSKRGAWR
jgi:hypothetical protein